MLSVTVRKQGGAAIITIPPVLLKQLGIHVGSPLELHIEDHTLVIRPMASRRKKRYSLTQLLEGVTAAKMEKLKQSTKWTEEGPSVGREFP